jgi:rsbT co-antagonist protein RsbR
MDDMLVRERITEVLVVLSAIGAGSLDERLPAILGADDPFAQLFEGINEVVESLAASQTRVEAYQRELEARLQTIEQQRHAIRELSTPVIEVWEGVLCLPVVGVVDTVRSAEMTEALLRTVIEKKTRYAIVDVTGIEVMDTRTTDHFIRMARAVRLLGAECVLAGISAVIAQTIVHMGVDLAGLVTFRTMREALHHHVQKLTAAAPAASTRTRAPVNGTNSDAGLADAAPRPR